MSDVAPGPYEHTGAYQRPDLLRQWIETAADWKSEALRLAAENRELKARIELFYAPLEAPDA